MQNDELLRLENITKSFPLPKGGTLDILKDISLTLHSGESVAITGKSGSGKSTLLSIAALLSLPSGGKICYMGKEVSSFSDRALSSLRNRNMGFVFQNSMLLEDFSALENTAMPLLIRGEKRKDALEKAMHYLTLVGMEDRADHRPSALSGGERQRTAIARALSGDANIIFADEPTGSLDEETGLITEALLLDAVKKEKRGLVLVTHNLSFAEKAERTFTLQNGVLYEK